MINGTRSEAFFGLFLKRSNTNTSGDFLAFFLVRCLCSKLICSLTSVFLCVFLGGESAWGAPFKDEFKPNLVHQGGWQKNSCMCVLYYSCVLKYLLSVTLVLCCMWTSPLSFSVTIRKQPTFRDVTTAFPAKLRLRNERRNSKLLARINYPDLGSDASSVLNFCARSSDVISRGNVSVVASRNVGCFLRLC